jgi:hypothetical protein
MQDTTAKLAQCEASLKRWHTRLARASNMVAKLEKQRRRLAPARTLAERTARHKADGFVPGHGAVTAAPPERVVVDADDDLKIPAMLDRSNPVIAERMTAARKAAEAEARRAMPLSGRAALDAIRPKRKKTHA